MSEETNIFFYGWGADYPDPDSFLRTSYPLYRCKWHDEVYQRLVRDARKITDQEERMKLYRQAEKILIEEAPLLPLAYARHNLLVKPWIKKHPLTGLANQFWKDVIIER